MTQDKTVSPTPDLKFEKTLELDKWLDTAINDKVKEGLLTFNAPQNNNLQNTEHLKKDAAPTDVFAREHSNPSIDLGRFGFKSPNDLKNFLLTPAGESVKSNIHAKIALDESIKKEQEFQLREKEEMKHRLKGILFLYIIEKQAHAAKQLNELIAEQNNNAMKQNASNTATQHKTTQPKVNAGMQQALANYDNAIKSFEGKQEELVQEEQKLHEELSKLENQKEVINNKHETYNQSLEEFDKSQVQYEKLSPEELDSEMQKLETQINEQTDEISSLLEQDKEGEARALLDKQNALNLKLASLHDIRSKQQDEKSFYNDKGEQVGSHQEADFVVPSDKKIVEKDGEHFLLGKNEDINSMSAEAKNSAKESFEGSKHELMTVKAAVKNTQKLETDFHRERMQKTEAKLADNKSEQTQVENQIRLLQSSRATAEAAAQQPNPDAGPSEALTPRPSMSTSASSASAGVAASVAVVLEKHKDELENATPNSLSDLMKKKGPKSPAEQKDMQKFLSSQLQGIPSTTPVPFQVMQGLLKNMARFGADPNKPGLTAIPDPLDMKQAESKIMQSLDNAPKTIEPKKEASVAPKIEQKPEPKSEKRPEPESEPEAKKDSPFNPSPLKTSPQPGR